MDVSACIETYVKPIFYASVCDGMSKYLHISRQKSNTHIIQYNKKAISNEFFSLILSSLLDFLNFQTLLFWNFSILLNFLYFFIFSWLFQFCSVFSKKKIHDCWPFSSFSTSPDFLRFFTIFSDFSILHVFPISWFFFSIFSIFPFFPIFFSLFLFFTIFLNFSGISPNFAIYYFFFIFSIVDIS